MTEPDELFPAYPGPSAWWRIVVRRPSVVLLVVVQTVGTVGLASVARRHGPWVAGPALLVGGWVAGAVAARRRSVARRVVALDEAAERGAPRRPEPAPSWDAALAVLRARRRPPLGALLLAVPAAALTAVLVGMEGMPTSARVAGWLVGLPVSVAVGWSGLDAGRRWRALRDRPSEPVRCRVLGWDLGRRGLVLQPDGDGPRVRVPTRTFSRLHRLIRGDEVWLVGTPAASSLVLRLPVVAVVGPTLCLVTREATVVAPSHQSEPAPVAAPRTRIPGVLSRADVERREGRP